MSELRRNGGADDADKPAVNDQAADKPGARPTFEIRTADMNADWPVDRRAVTKAQRHYIDLVKQNGDVPPGHGDPGFARNWATGESLDHKYPHIAGGKDRPKPDDAAGSARPVEKGFSGLDGRVFEETDDGWNDSLVSAGDRDQDAVPHADVTNPGGIPAELDPGRVRETSMTISEAREHIAGSRVESPPDFHRDNSRLEARVGDPEDEKWRDSLDGPMTGESDSKTKSLLKITTKGSDDVLNVIGGNTEIARGITERPPLKQAVGHVPPSSQDMPDPVHPPPGVDAATAIASALLTVGAVGSMMHEKYESRKDRHGGNG